MQRAVAVESYDLRETVTPNRLVGLWRMMTGFRLVYLVATISLAVTAVARLFLSAHRPLCRQRLGPGGSIRIAAVACRWVRGPVPHPGRLHLCQRPAGSKTSEGITRRLRNYLFDQIQRLSFTYHDHTPTGELIQRATSDVDAVRRFMPIKPSALAASSFSSWSTWRP